MMNPINNIAPSQGPAQSFLPQTSYMAAAPYPQQNPSLSMGQQQYVQQYPASIQQTPYAPQATVPQTSQGPYLQASQTPLMQHQTFNPYQSVIPSGLSGIPQQQQQFGQSAPPKKKISSAQMPSPVNVDASAPVSYDTGLATTNAPISSLVCTKFTDNGNAPLNFLRMTTHIPQTSSFASEAALPLSVVATPLADGGAVSVVDPGRQGPLRCHHCNSYINSHSKFVSGGREYVCRLCEDVNEVPENYFVPLDAYGKRTDLEIRPELKNGTVEFIASNPLYLPSSKPLAPPSFMFVVECSPSAQRCGVTSSVCQAIKRVLKTLKGTDANGQKLLVNKIGFITFSSNIHFWDLHGDKPRMYVIPNVKEKPFVPVFNHSNLFVDYNEKESMVDDLLDGISGKYAALHPTIGDKVCAVSALHAASEALRTIGGKIVSFHWSTSLMGEGEVEPRGDKKISEQDSLRPQNPAVLKSILPEFIKNGTAVDMFLLSDKNDDVTSLVPLSRNTGGSVFYIPRYDPLRNAIGLEAQIRRLMTEEFGIDAMFRVRTSNGISVDSYSGNIQDDSNEVDVLLCAISPSTTITAKLQYDEKLEEGSFVYVQSALVYTDKRGVRKIRVSTTQVKVENSIQTIFKSADIDAVLSVLVRNAVKTAYASGYTQAARMLRAECTNILSMYRKHFYGRTSSGQLLLPEALKLLPVYVQALLKDKGFTKGLVSVGERVAKYAFYMGCSPLELQLEIYPRMFPLHEIIGLTTPILPHGFPHASRLSQEFIARDGVYLVDDGTSALKIYIVSPTDVKPDVAQALFGESEIASVPYNDLVAGFYANAVCKEGLTQTLISSISSLRRNNCYCVEIGRQEDIKDLMKEDGDETYSDFMCTLHKEIQAKLD